MSLREHVSLREHACVSSRGAQSTELVSLYIGYWTLNNYYYYYYYYIYNRLSKLENSDSQITNSDKYNNVKASVLEKKIESIDITQRTINVIFTKLPEPQIEEGGNYVIEEKTLVEVVLELESLDFNICGRN